MEQQPFINEYTFEGLFKEYYGALQAYAQTILIDEDIAEEVVQNMFLRVWENRRKIKVETSVKAFLYRCVHNDALNHIKHERVKLKYQEYSKSKAEDNLSAASSKLELSELELKIKTALNELPEQCRTVFQLSRFEELKYREIADQLGISIKTVENHMSKALKYLRIQLVEYISVVPLMLTSLAILSMHFFK